MIVQRIFRRGMILLDRIVSPPPPKKKERNVLSHFLVRLMAILSFSPFRETTGVETKNIYMHVCLSLKWLYPNNSFFVVFWFCGTFVSWQSRLKAVQINFIFSSATNSKFQRILQTSWSSCLYGIFTYIIYHKDSPNEGKYKYTLSVWDRYKDSACLFFLGSIT